MIRPIALKSPQRSLPVSHEAHNQSGNEDTLRGRIASTSMQVSPLFYHCHHSSSHSPLLRLCLVA